MFQQSQVPGFDPAQEAVEFQVKCRIVVFNDPEGGFNGNAGIQLFADFPHQRLLRRFPFFDLSAGELPISLEITVPPPDREKLPAGADDRR